MRAIKAALISGFLLLGLAVAPSPVDAHYAGNPSCSSGALCVYWDSHFGGSRSQFFGSNWSWHSWSIADDDSSSYNKGTSGKVARIWENTGYGGQRVVCLKKGWATAHHSPNDKGSSNDWQWNC